MVGPANPRTMPVNPRAFVSRSLQLLPEGVGVGHQLKVLDRKTGEFSCVAKRHADIIQGPLRCWYRDADGFVLADDAGALQVENRLPHFSTDINPSRLLRMMGDKEAEQAAADSELAGAQFKELRPVFSLLARDRGSDLRNRAHLGEHMIRGIRRSVAHPLHRPGIPTGMDGIRWQDRLEIRASDRIGKTN